MLSRKALIIGSPDAFEYLPGVELDVRDLKKFLCSPMGGAWLESELIVLKNPKRSEVLAAMEQCSSANYSFVSFSGHGEHHKGHALDETVVYLTENDKMYVSEINPKNSRHFILVDACRKVVQVLLRDSFEVMNKAFAARKVELDWVTARRLFDAAVTASAEGRIVAYSCEINQAAGENEKGGVFTQHLISAPLALDTVYGGGRRVVSVKEAFTYAKEKTYAANAPQSPVLNLGRRLDSFPFGIV